MGGTALGFQAARIPAAEVGALYDQVASNICDLFPGEYEVVTSMIPAYATKPDFGDIDVLLHGPAKYMERIKGDPGAVFPNWSGHIYNNGGVVSVGIKHGGGIAQVDIISTGEDWGKHMAAYSYFAYNDLGNLMGRIAHRMGFKFGHEGLSYMLRDETTGHVYGEYKFDMAHSDILEFMGLDATRWEAGFQTLEEIFEFVTSSPYFHPAIYLLDNVNAVSRIRDKKRKTYMTFLDWLERRGPRETDLEFRTDADKRIFREYLFRSKMLSDPDFATWVQGVKFAHAETGYAKVFFDGARVMEWTGLSGKELGAFLGDFRDHVEARSVLTFSEFVVMMQGEIRQFAMDFFNQWKEA